MTDFDRRSFLGSLFAAAGIAATPDWLAGAMSPQDPANARREKQLRAAAQRAKDEGKPLLIFLAPSDANNATVYPRGLWLGAWLNHGGGRALHAVALCVLACANRGELQRVFGVEIEGQPLMLLIDSAGYGDAKAQRPKVTAAKLDIRTLEMPGPGRGLDESIAEQQKVIADGLAKLSAEVQDLQNRHGTTVARVAADTMPRLSSVQRETLAAWFAGGAAPADALIVRAAAEVRRMAATADGEERFRLLDALTAAVTTTVVERPIAGARWKLPGGCGEVFEEPLPEEKAEQVAVPCGMGSVPPLCKRFLDLYTAGA